MPQFIWKHPSVWPSTSYHSSINFWRNWNGNEKRPRKKRVTLKIKRMKSHANSGQKCQKRMMQQRQKIKFRKKNWYERAVPCNWRKRSSLDCIHHLFRLLLSAFSLLALLALMAIYIVSTESQIKLLFSKQWVCLPFTSISATLYACLRDWNVNENRNVNMHYSTTKMLFLLHKSMRMKFDQTIDFAVFKRRLKKAHG